MDRKELLNFIYKLTEEIKDQKVLKTLITRDEIAMLLSFYHELVNNSPQNEQKEGKKEVLDKSNKIKQEEQAEVNFRKYETINPCLESYLNTITCSVRNIKNAFKNYCGGPISKISPQYRERVVNMNIKNIEIATQGLNLVGGITDEKEDKDSIV